MNLIPQKNIVKLGDTKTLTPSAMEQDENNVSSNITKDEFQTMDTQERPNKFNCLLNVDGSSDECLNTWVLPKESFCKEEANKSIYNEAMGDSGDKKGDGKNGENCVVMGRKSITVVPANKYSQDQPNSQGVKRKPTDDDEIISLPSPNPPKPPAPVGRPPMATVGRPPGAMVGRPPGRPPFQDSSSQNMMKRRNVEDGNVGGQQPRPVRPPFDGRTTAVPPNAVTEKRDPNSDNMAKMIGKLTARVDFLEQDLNLGSDTPKSLMDRLRSLEENAIKSIHGDENEFVLKPYLRDKLNIIEQRMEPLEKIPMNYSIDIEAVMDRLTKAEESIGDVKTKLIGMIYKHKDLEGRLDSLEESVASKVIKAIKESNSFLGSVSKNLSADLDINVKEEPNSSKNDTKKEVRSLKQQFNSMDMLVTKSLEETTKSNHHINSRLQKLETNSQGNKEVHAFLSQVKLLKQNSVGLKVIDARVDALENSLTNQPRECTCDCKSKSSSSPGDINPLAEPIVSVTPVHGQVITEHPMLSNNPITDIVPFVKKSRNPVDLKAVKPPKFAKIKTEKADHDANNNVKLVTNKKVEKVGVFSTNRKVEKVGVFSTTNSSANTPTSGPSNTASKPPQVAVKSTLLTVNEVLANSRETHNDAYLIKNLQQANNFDIDIREYREF